MKNTTLKGKPYAGNPHVRFDDGRGAPEKPSRGSLIYGKLIFGAILGLQVLSGYGATGWTDCLKKRVANKIPEFTPITPIGLQPSSPIVVKSPKVKRFDDDKAPAYVQPSVNEAIKYWQQKIHELPKSPVPDVNAYKKAVPLANKMIEDDHVECGRQFVRLASKAELDPFVRYVLSRKAINVCAKEDEWNLVEELLDSLAEIDGVDFALEVIRTKRPQLKYVRKAQSVLMKIGELEKTRRFFRNRYRSLKTQKGLEGSDKDAVLHAEAALHYLMLGSVTNAHAELVMSNPSWDRIMRETEGECFKRPKTFIWEAPKPEITVADFWRKYGADKQGRAKAYCDTVSREWYGKVLKISNEWVDDQLNPLFWRWRMTTQINKVSNVNHFVWSGSSFNPYYLNACGLKFPVSDLFVSREKTVQVESDCEFGEERAYRPASFWLKRCEPVIFREDKTRILIIPMNVMPLRDEDFNSAGRDFPSERRLSFKFERSEKVSGANYKKWIAFYYGCEQTDVVLPNEAGVNRVSLVKIKGMPVIGAIVEVNAFKAWGKNVFVDFQPIDGCRLSEERIKKILQFIKVE